MLCWLWAYPTGISRTAAPHQCSASSTARSSVTRSREARFQVIKATWSLDLGYHGGGVSPTEVHAPEQVEVRITHQWIVRGSEEDAKCSESGTHDDDDLCDRHRSSLETCYRCEKEIVRLQWDSSFPDFHCMYTVGDTEEPKTATSTRVW